MLDLMPAVWAQAAGEAGLESVRQWSRAYRILLWEADGLTVPAPEDGIAAATDLSDSEESFYGRFVAPLQRPMMRTIWRIVRDTDKARDVLQEALVTVWRRREIIEAHPNPPALILRICIHSAIGSLRTLHRRQRIERNETEGPPQGSKGRPDLRIRREGHGECDLQQRDAVRLISG